MLSTPWTFGCLQPVRHPAADGNAEWLGARTLGIEVTEPELAMHCGLGNIDPQHGAQSCAVGPAAIEAAIEWPLPPLGARLVTLRPDADSLGAMAVLWLRHIGVPIEGDLLARVRLVARWDRFDLGSWLDWKASHPFLPRPATARDLGGSPLAIRTLAAMAHGRALSLPDKVERMAAWLERGALDPASLISVRGFEAGLVQAWNRGRIELKSAAGGRIAVVSAAHPGALRLGYRLAPVVIAEGRMGSSRRFSVAQFELGWINMPRLKMELNTLEAGWGGTATIIGSPQGADTQLTPIQILAAAERCLMSINRLNGVDHVLAA